MNVGSAPPDVAVTETGGVVVISAAGAYTALVNDVIVIVTRFPTTAVTVPVMLSVPLYVIVMLYPN